VPKCGGSSIDKLFKDNGYSATLEMRDMPAQECLIASPQHQTSSNLKTMINMDNLNAIFIVARSPYTRVISEYNWQFREVETCNRPDINSWIIDSLEKAKEDPNYADNHFKPCSDFIDTDHQCNIFKLEDGIEMVAEFFLRKTGSTGIIEIPNEKKAKNFTESINNPTLSTSAIKKINEFYKDDFEAFGYPIITQDFENASSSALAQDSKYLDAKKKIRIIQKWREETYSNLFRKILNELNAFYSNMKEGSSSIFIERHCNQSDPAQAKLASQTLYEELQLTLDHTELYLRLYSSTQSKINSTNLIKMLEMLKKYRELSRNKRALTHASASIRNKKFQ
jgi:hypothetical protein